MDDPEEIKKWIASRKANFPTEENIRRKRERAEDVASHGGVEFSTFELRMRQRMELTRRSDYKQKKDKEQSNNPMKNNFLKHYGLRKRLSRA
jgi:hypothetical protein